MTAATATLPPPGRAGDRGALEEALGHRFREPALLAEALTHASAGSGRRDAGRPSYERLEFLGDRVLGLVVAHLLIERFPEDAEGALSGRHEALVRGATLAEIGARLGLGALLEVDRGEARSGGRGKPAVLEDACEAVIGALYLDGGLEVARRFVERAWGPFLAGVAASPPRDAKSALQEWAQGRGMAPPAYRIASAEGPPHAPRFTVEASLAGFPACAGEGPSRRAAEQEAARRLLGLAEAGGDAARG